MKFLQYIVVFFLSIRIFSYRNLHKKTIYLSCINLHAKKEKKVIDTYSNDCYKLFTPNQRKIANYLTQEEDNITIIEGPAGTGKTWVACHIAVQLLKSNFINKIIITRPLVSVEEDIGFLPGTINTKMNPWVRPILDIFEETYSRSQINQMLLDGKIEISPLGFMRGRTFKSAFIIADEMQNSSPMQMLMLLTRIGINARMAITGDLRQSDTSNSVNGLKEFIDKYERTLNLKNIHIIRLNDTDVKRSYLVSEVLRIYHPTNNSIQTYTPKYTINNNFTKFINLDTNGNDDAALIPRRLFRKTL